MAAFAASTQEIVLDETHPDVQANFELILLSRAHEAASKKEQRQANAGGGRGFQSLSVFQSGAGQDTAGGSMSDVVPSGMPVPGIAPDSATESVAVSGNTSNSFNAMSADEMQQRFNDARQQGGGFGGGDLVAPAAEALVVVVLVAEVLAGGVLTSIARMDRSTTGSAIRR